MTYRGWCPEVAQNSRGGAHSWVTLGGSRVPGEPGAWTPGLGLLVGLGRPRPYPTGVTERCQGGLTPAQRGGEGLVSGRNRVWFSPQVPGWMLEEMRLDGVVWLYCKYFKPASSAIWGDVFQSLASHPSWSSASSWALEGV